MAVECIVFLSLIVFLVKVVLLREEVLRTQRSGGWEGVWRGAVAGWLLNYQNLLVSRLERLEPLWLEFQGR